MKSLFLIVILLGSFVFADNNYSISGIAAYIQSIDSGLGGAETCRVDFRLTKNKIALEFIKFSGYVRVFRSELGVEIPNSARVEKREILISNSLQGMELLSGKKDENYFLEARINNRLLHKAIVGTDSQGKIVSAQILYVNSVFGSRSSEVIEGYCSFFNETDL